MGNSRKTKTKVKTLDFEKLDKMFGFGYKEDLYATLKNLGFSYASQLVYYWYVQQKEPASTICRILSISKSQVYTWMRRWNFDRRPRGGNTRNRFLSRKEVERQIVSCRGVLTATETANFIGCSYLTIRNIWKKND